MLVPAKKKKTDLNNYERVTTLKLLISITFLFSFITCFI